MRTDPVSETLTVHRVQGVDDPWFDTGYSLLNQYFGVRDEMETREVIERRLAWNPADTQHDIALMYEMVVIVDHDGDIAAVGDYSVMLSRSAIIEGQAAVVHLSHIWVNPHKPGRGIVNRHMFELTTDAAKRALTRAGLPEHAPSTLAAEMEPITAGNDERIRRIKRFLLAGLRLVDPGVIDYLQPDFRPPAVIDSSGDSQPLHLVLMLRRIGREQEDSTCVGEIRHIVQCLYHMYAQGIRPQEMTPVLQSLESYPRHDLAVKLLSRVPR